MEQTMHIPRCCLSFPSTTTVACSSNGGISGNKVAYRLARDFQFANSSESPTVLSIHSPLPPPAASADRTISLPIDFYKVLGADTHFLSDGIRRAFEVKCSTPPLDGFSQDALLARRQILQAACDTLSNPGTVPGVLCLLQESGEAEVVIQVGKRLLRERLSKPFKRDVVLAMALAYVDRSRDAMALSPPDLISSCDALERALKLLKEEGATNLAPSLQVQIDETLEEITPRYVLELLALPLDEEYRRRRDEGLLGVRNILWAVGGGGADAIGGGFTRGAFMKEAFSCMTAAEQVDLYLDRPSNVAVEGFEVYMAALAFVAQAFVCKRPELIKTADSLFLELQEAKVAALGAASDYAAKADLETEFALGRGLCSLLVGTFHCRSQAVVDFIMEHSNEDEDGNLLLGLCTLLEHWLMQVVFPRFRETQNVWSRIGDYFDDPNVLEHLQMLEGGGGSPLAAAAAIARMGARATAALDSVKSNAIQALWRVFPVGGSDRNDEMQTEGLEPRSGADVLDDSVERFGGLTSKDSTNQGFLTAMTKANLKILCACVTVGILASLRFRFSSARSLTPVARKGVDSAVAADVTNLDLPLSESSPGETARMDVRLAEDLVRQWQSTKSQALGPHHSLEKLSEVLDGEMLKVWAERASEIAGNGWFWEYELLGLSIDSVTVSLDGRRAVVEATLDEASRLTDPSRPEHNDSTRAAYSVRYAMSYAAPAGWRITHGAVLRPS
ncbi:unnamed protein product [Spirodela intermedia]|uniref:Uncharacterized protein n=1 Tax=Spirodela intermedia TaxID=51605 RepID=A0A7I8IG55_SPIIN|nr:unnamed protein product [Spirodela intermedia]CAA6656375.1 unnamed protein product [Spirodela intermedia]